MNNEYKSICKETVISAVESGGKPEQITGARQSGKIVSLDPAPPLGGPDCGGPMEWIELA